MKDIQFSYAKAVSAEAVQAYKQQVAIAQEQLVNGTGLGNDFLPAFCKSRMAITGSRCPT